MSYQHRLPLSVCAVLVATAATAPMHVQAANSTDASDVVSLEEITVTARKRSEDILQTPVTVNALTSADIEARGIVSINSLVAATPGMNINAGSSGRSDRTFAQIIIRGFTPSATTNQATAASTFIDGVPVASATALQSIDDPERVEVLKGPQSAYFGRATFSGAVNVVTKSPTDTYSGSVSTMLGTRNNSDVHADFSGPVFGDALGFRATFRKFSKDGSYVNGADSSQTLGDQSTTTGTLALQSKPIEGLTIKAFGMLSKDDDGASAQGLLTAYPITNAAGQVVYPGQSNCVLDGRASGVPGNPGLNVHVANPFFCGTAPKLIVGPAANTAVTPNIRAFLNKPTGRLVAPGDGTTGYGKLSRMYHAHLVLDYDIANTGFKVSSLTGWNRENYSTLVDLDNFDGRNTLFPVPQPPSPQPAVPPVYYDFPFYVERQLHDFSQELRTSYDNSGAFRATAGVSYLNAFVQAGLGTVHIFPNFTGFADPAAPAGTNTPGGATRSKTSGIFFGLSYDFTQQLTVDAEGRYQIDNLIAYASPRGTGANFSTVISNPTFAPVGTYAAGSELLNQKFKNFVPRVIVKYKWTPDLMTYVSWSKGVNPGQFNTNFLTANALGQQAASNLGLTVAVQPEKVTNYEAGVKGKFFDGRLRLSAAVYYAHWTDQINGVSVFYVDTTGQPQTISGTRNAGDVKLKGVEFDATALVAEHFTLNLGGAYNDSDIQKYINPIVSLTTGVFDYSGKQMPLTSKYSASAGAQYDGKLASVEEGSWFARGDFTYKSGMYSNAANVVKTDASEVFNFRLGVSKGPASVEAFVLNAFNNTAYISIADNNVIAPGPPATPATGGNGAYSNLIVGLPDLRTYGVKAKYKF